HCCRRWRTTVFKKWYSSSILDQTTPPWLPNLRSWAQSWSRCAPPASCLVTSSTWRPSSKKRETHCSPAWGSSLQVRGQRSQLEPSSAQCKPLASFLNSFLAHQAPWSMRVRELLLACDQKLLRCRRIDATPHRHASTGSSRSKPFVCRLRAH